MLNSFKSKLLAVLLAVATVIAIPASAQLIYGNTFPFWNVTGPLTVTGTTTLSGPVVMSGGTSLTGTTTNDSAAAGVVGEQLTTTVAAGSAVAGAATTVSKNVTSVSLTAGDWDVSGSCNMLGSTLIATVLSCGLGTTTNTQATQAGGSGIGTDPLTLVSFASQTIPDSVNTLRVSPTRVSLAATTTIYLVANNTFSSGSYTMYGTIRARRMR